MPKVILSANAEKDLKDTRRTPYYKTIISRLTELEANPFYGNVKQLKNFPYAKYRKRVGRYRILFSIDYSKQKVFVYRIIQRKDAY